MPRSEWEVKDHSAVLRLGADLSVRLQKEGFRVGRPSGWRISELRVGNNILYANMRNPYLMELEAAQRRGEALLSAMMVALEEAL